MATNRKNIAILFDASLLFMVTRLSLQQSYDQTCPHQSQWNHRQSSFNCTEPHKYQCLMIDNSFSYKEDCGQSEKAREGFRYILRPNPDQVECSPTRYQPFQFDSLVQSDCFYKKSGCSEEGQFIFDYGSSNSNFRCSCNYTKGYVFLFAPANQRSCNPSTEDCTCIKRPCAGKNEIMLADFRCIDKNWLLEQVATTRKVVIAENYLPFGQDPQKQFSKPSRVLGLLFMNASIVLTIVFDMVVVVIILIQWSTVVTELTITSKTCFIEETQEQNCLRYKIVPGAEVTILVDIISKFPVKSAVWCIENKPTSKGTFNKSKTTGCLTLDRFQENDVGTYQCRVENLMMMKNTTFEESLKLFSCMNLINRYFENLPRSYSKVHLEMFKVERDIYFFQDEKFTIYPPDPLSRKGIWERQPDCRKKSSYSTTETEAKCNENGSLIIESSVDIGEYNYSSIGDNEHNRLILYKVKVISKVRDSYICEQDKDAKLKPVLRNETTEGFRWIKIKMDESSFKGTPFGLEFSEKDNVWLIQKSALENAGKYGFAKIDDANGEILSDWVYEADLDVFQKVKLLTQKANEGNDCNIEVDLKGLEINDSTWIKFDTNYPELLIYKEINADKASANNRFIKKGNTLKIKDCTSDDEGSYGFIIKENGKFSNKMMYKIKLKVEPPEELKVGDKPLSGLEIPNYAISVADGLDKAGL